MSELTEVPGPLEIPCQNRVVLKRYFERGGILFEIVDTNENIGGIVVARGDFGSKLAIFDFWLNSELLGEEHPEQDSLKVAALQAMSNHILSEFDVSSLRTHVPRGSSEEGVLELVGYRISGIYRNDTDKPWLAMYELSSLVGE